MIYKPGDVVLVNFPFTDLLSSKVRPAIVITTKGEDIIILGVFAICFLLLYTAFKIDKEKHFILQLIILIFTIVVMILIPKTIMDYSDNFATAGIFYKAVLWFIRIFWVYMFFYLIKEMIVPLKKIRLRFHK